MVRLAYLSPDVLEWLVISRDPPSVSVNELIEITYLPWAKQTERVFDGRPSTRAWATNRTKAAGQVFPLR